MKAEAFSSERFCKYTYVVTGVVEFSEHVTTKSAKFSRAIQMNIFDLLRDDSM